MQTSNPGKSAGTSHPSPSVAAVLVGGAAFASTMQNPTDGILCQGWLLKKRRKKMQGYAKRYFTLSSQGILSYAFQPSAPIRDQITLRLASITSSANERSRAIHIDSAAVTFHLKALGPTDYTIWMSALRRFCTFAVNPNAPEPAMSPRSARGSISMSRSWSLPAQTARALLAAQDMNTTIKELESLVSELTSLEPTKKKSKHQKDKDKDKDHHHNKDLLKLFHRKGHQGTPTSTPITPSFPSDTGSLSPDPLSPTMGSPPSSPPNSLNQLERLQAAVATLRAQHNALVNVIEGGVSGPGQTGSPLLRVQEDIAMNSPRHSLGTLESVSPSVWFDAEEGAEEFVLVAEPTESGQTSATASDVDEAEANDAGSDDTLDREADSHTTPTLTPTKSSFATERLDGSVKAVVRRTRLPHPTSGDDGSLLTVLRKNVGKVSTVNLSRDAP
ncbi:hypothetical protein FRB99_000307 [Tulasnella sp. 403]|nr:hypothetical protein FRB99_000307 [Tulasnella sp. 403]